MAGCLEHNLPNFGRNVLYPALLWQAGWLVGRVERNLPNFGGRNVLYPTLLWLCGWLAGWLAGWNVIYSTLVGMYWGAAILEGDCGQVHILHYYLFLRLKRMKLRYLF